MQITRPQERLVCRTSVKLKVGFNATLKQPFTRANQLLVQELKCESKGRTISCPSLKYTKNLHVPTKMPLHIQVLYFVL